MFVFESLLKLWRNSRKMQNKQKTTRYLNLEVENFFEIIILGADL